MANKVSTPRVVRKPKLRDSRLFWRDDSPYIYCSVPDPNGGVTPGGKPKTVIRSTFALDETAASAKADEYERKALSPSYRAASTTTIASAVDGYCDHLRACESKAHPGQRIKPTTVDKILAEKFGMLLKFAEECGFEGGTMPLVRVNGDWVTQYINWRRSHKSGRKDGSTVSNYTIKRELNYLRACLKHAAFLKRFHTPIDQVIPPGFGGACRRVERYPSRDEASAILAGLPGPERAAHIAALIGGGLRWKESIILRRSDVDLNEGVLYVGGRVRSNDLKNAASQREIPITPVMEPILRWVLLAAPGKGENDLLFKPWSNPTLQIKRVCDRLGIRHYSVHDMRRAFTHLHLDAGIDYAGAAALLRHTGGTKLVETTYGRVREAARLRARIVPLMTREVGLPTMPPAVRLLCGASGSNETQTAPVAHETAEKSTVSLSSPPLFSAVHGRGANPAQPVEIVEIPVAVQPEAVRESVEAPAPGVPGLGSALPPGPDVAPPSGAEVEASPGAPQDGHGGAPLVAEALGVIRALFASRAASQAEREVLDRALALLTREPSAAE